MVKRRENIEKSPFGAGFYARLFALAFALNWVWEMTQMITFKINPAESRIKIFIFCTLATVIDALVTIGIYESLKKIGVGNRLVFYSLAAALGAGLAIGFERFAFRFELWEYNEKMPVVPILGTGLLPLAQLTLLVPLAIWLANRFLGRK